MNCVVVNCMNEICAVSYWRLSRAGGERIARADDSLKASIRRAGLSVVAVRPSSPDKGYFRGSWAPTSR